MLSNHFKTFIKSILTLATFTAVAVGDYDQGPSFYFTDLDENNHPANTMEERGFSEPQGFMVDIHGLIINNILQPYKSYTHDLADFGLTTLVGENPDTNLRPRALAWSADGAVLYGMSRTTTRYLIEINPVNGVSTQLATFFGQGQNVTLQGIAIDENNTCYVVATDNANHNTISTLYECDLATGELTEVGTNSMAPDIHDIAATCDGEMYGVDAASKSLYRLNKQDGSAEFIGPSGVNSSYGMYDLTYDRENRVLYQYVIGSTGHHTALTTINKDTGTATYIQGGFIYGNMVGAIESTCDNDLIFLHGFD